VSTPLKFALKDATEALAKLPEPFVTLMQEDPTRLLLFAPRGEDVQTPHTQDEVYVVTSGCGRFRRDHEVVDFATGDLLFVPAKMPHRFEDFSDDLATWVIFFGPRKT
jgi:mannose-6-phosphate isomerase-like protein (cupin superfamily)